MRRNGNTNETGYNDQGGSHIFNSVNNSFVLECCILLMLFECMDGNSSVSNVTAAHGCEVKLSPNRC